VTDRKAFYADGVSHKNPIPPASRIGNFIATGIVSGRDKDRKVSPDATEQARAMLKNLEKVLEAAGASMDDVLKLNVWIASEPVRECGVARNFSRSRNAACAPGDDLRAFDGRPASLLRCAGGGQGITSIRITFPCSKGGR
jgi:hypothetical protein